jgi:hypothetical protein
MILSSGLMTAGPRPTEQDVSEDAPLSELDLRAGRFIRLWNKPLLGHPAIRTALLIVIVLLCLVRAYTGLSGIQVYTHDAFGALDGAWRVLHGQKPHADFYSPLGPIIYLSTAFGLMITHGGAEGFGYSQALCGMLLGAWSYLLSRRRLGHFPAILACLTVVLLSINPTSVGEPPPSTSCMPYNRYGYALVALLMIESLAAPERTDDRVHLLGGLSTGLVLALLLFLKFSFFVAAIGLTAVLVPCRKQSRERLLGILGGFALLFLLFWAYLGFTLRPMWNDVRMVAGAKSPRMTWFIVNNLYLGVACYLAFIFTTAHRISKDGAVQLARAILIAGVAICAGGIFLLSTNFQFFGLPLNALMVILVLKQLAGCAPFDRANLRQYALLLLWGGAIVGWNLTYESLGLAFSVYQKMDWETTPNSAFDAPVLAGFRSCDRPYVDLVNDGLRLVNRHRRSGDTIMSLDFSNPFSYALGMAPAPGGATTLHYRGNFSDQSHPAPEFLFGRASLVIVPVVPTDKGLAKSVPRIYGPYLAAHFQLIGQSAGWRLYRHNAGQEGYRAL